MAAEMTSRERILTTLRHEEPDRVPISPRASKFLGRYYADVSGWERNFQAIEEFGWDYLMSAGTPVPNFIGYCPLSGYEILEPEVKVELDVQEDDRVHTVDRTFHTPAGPLHDVVMKPKPRGEFGFSPTPRHVEPLFKSREDLARLKYLFVKPEKVKWDKIHRVKEIVDGKGGIASWVVRGPLTRTGADAWEMSEMMLAYYDDRQLFREYVGTFFEQTMAETKAVLEQGAELLDCTWYYCSISTGWSPEIYREEFAPLIKKQAELAHSYDAIYMLYDDGKVMGNLETMRDCGIDILWDIPPPPMGDVDLAEAKRRIGDDVTLFGFVDHMNVVTFGTPELIRETVRDAIQIGAPGGGFILGTSDSIQDMAPVENVRAYSEAALEFRTYPIS